MKIRIILNIALFFLCIKAFSFETSDIREMTFENGLKMYLIEDASAALVTVELRVGAGYERQNEKTFGYAPLLARLKDAEISSGSVSKKIVSSPQQAEKSFKILSKILEPISINDKNLQSEIKIEKENVSEYEKSAAGFINSSIEARLFPQSPWKRESSIDPAVFSKKSVTEARTILGEIETLYIPSNARLYVSGNITAFAAESFAAKYFSRFEKKNLPESKTEFELKVEKNIENFGKKFVFIDSEFSAEMSQIVAIWTNFSQDEALIAATALDENFSVFKKTLVEEKSLGIRAAEYINASSVQRKNSSRLIVQTLLEKTQVSEIEQIQKFDSILKNGDFFSKPALDFELRQFISESEKRRDSSAALLSLLADFHDLGENWSLEKRTENLKNARAETLSAKIKEEPYIFVFLNNDIYVKNEQSIKNAGFSLVTKENGAWWKNDFYAKLLHSADSFDTNANDFENETLDLTAKATFESAQRFVERNRADFSQFSLSNGIPVVLKKTATNTACISISIDGGELEFARENLGLASVFADSLAVNIREQLDLLFYNDIIRGSFEVGAETDAVQSTIAVTFSADEFAQTLGAISSAIVYGDISPALADGICYDERRQWRLKSGSAEFQELQFAMQKIFENQDIAAVFQNDERPKKIEFSDILKKYPDFIDSARMSLVIAGNFSANSTLKNALDLTLGSISKNPVSFSKKSVGTPNFQPFSKKINLRHLFLTDISAEKAGPRPVTLIPTTKFLDPITYILPAPKGKNGLEARFCALSFEIAAKMEEILKKSEKTARVRFVPETAEIPFSRFVILNIERTGNADKAFQKAVSDLKSELEKIVEDEIEFSQIAGANLVDLEKNALLCEIESLWLVNALGENAGAKNTAALVQKGARQGTPDKYLLDYLAVDSSAAADYISIIGANFSTLPPIRIYSADSKK